MANAVEKALNIIDLLGNQKEISLTELAKKIGLSKATTHRLLQNLKAGGYVEQNRITRRYGLGLKIVIIAHKVLGNVDLRIKARPVLEDLLEETKESIHLAGLQTGEVLFIDSLASVYSLRVHKLPGERGPAHCTAVGKVLLAHSGPAKVNAIVRDKGLSKLTPKTITSAADLKRRLNMVRKQGFAIDDEESNPGCRCVAAPIRDHRGEVIAAISITGPSTRITPGRFDRLAELAKRAGDKISAHLGFDTKPISE